MRTGQPHHTLAQAGCGLCVLAPGERGQRIISLDYRPGLDAAGSVDRGLDILIVRSFCAKFPCVCDMSAKSPEGSQPLCSGLGAYLFHSASYD